MCSGQNSAPHSAQVTTITTRRLARGVWPPDAEATAPAGSGASLQRVVQQRGAEEFVNAANDRHGATRPRLGEHWLVASGLVMINLGRPRGRPRRQGRRPAARAGASPVRRPAPAVSNCRRPARLRGDGVTVDPYAAQRAAQTYLAGIGDDQDGSRVPRSDGEQHHDGDLSQCTFLGIIGLSSFTVHGTSTARSGPRPYRGLVRGQVLGPAGPRRDRRLHTHERQAPLRRRADPAPATGARSAHTPPSPRRIPPPRPLGRPVQRDPQVPRLHRNVRRASTFESWSVTTSICLHRPGRSRQPRS